MSLVLSPEAEATLALKLRRTVNLWVNWLAQWQLANTSTRTTICVRCAQSPFGTAIGFTTDVPHQVKHALILRLQKLIDDEVEQHTRTHLPLLAQHLDTSVQWQSQAGYDPRAKLSPEYADGQIDPVPLNTQAPFLFTLAELAQESVTAASPEPLPLPPLTAAEKAQLKAEIAHADQVALLYGRTICRLVTAHRLLIQDALDKYVEPQIEQLFAQLSEGLQNPSF